MPFFKYTAEFPFIHECPESEAQFCDISQLNIERRKTVRAKRPVQQLKAEIAALAERIESSARVGDVMQPLEIFRELRQLSAV